MMAMKISVPDIWLDTQRFAFVRLPTEGMMYSEGCPRQEDKYIAKLFAS
jgi:hypothetical protein